ncbi:ribosomal protein S5 domain 2-type protein [Podospora appendiculata]|uniref:Small ribosomal subunit protein uS9m n=1 Tax=Podospora appendiculata TaxID=314037 RepID=A0AAE0X5H3_9PEZI|nr:ribosomal protein S5 domain 2-type protein [Podospora appendiculata]
MAALRQNLTGALRGSCPGARLQWQTLDQQFHALRLGGSSSSSSITAAAAKASTSTSTSRCMSTDAQNDSNSNTSGSQTEFRSIIASPENTLRIATHARPVPLSPSYFSRQPVFNDSYLTLQKLMRSYGNLPVIPAGQVERVAWNTLEDTRQTLGEHVKASDYAKCIELVKRLHAIHPTLKPEAVTAALQAFKRNVQPFSNVPNPIVVDKFGRALGVGRRKASVARAWVVEGTGEVQVNGKNLADAFGRVHDRESAVWPLRATARVDKYNVWALVEGGGTTGQAEALTLAIAKALMAHEPALKPALRRAGCVTRDPRRVERKKHGRVKARKMPTWVKR